MSIKRTVGKGVRHTLLFCKIVGWDASCLFFRQTFLTPGDKYFLWTFSYFPRHMDVAQIHSLTGYIQYPHFKIELSNQFSIHGHLVIYIQVTHEHKRLTHSKNNATGFGISCSCSVISQWGSRILKVITFPSPLLQEYFDMICTFVSIY